MLPTHNVVIIGGGPAGYTAAIYASRANLKPILYQGPQPGGQLTTTTQVENYPGYPDGIQGPQLMQTLQQQAQRFGAQIRTGTITAVNLEDKPYQLTIDDKETITTHTIIIATGLLAGGITAFAGPIAFVGLAVPHLTRQIFDTMEHKVLIPAVMLYGAILMLLCDTLAQLPNSASVLPINAITSLVGAPVVIWLLVRKRKMMF